MAANLAFGLGRAVPTGVAAAWGARWIWPDDQVYDRQHAIGTEDGKAELIAWLNGGACQRARAVARNLAGMETAPAKPRRGRVKFNTSTRTWHPRPPAAVTVKPNGPLWHSNDSDERELYRDDRGVIVGCPNGSYGYLYVAAWLHPKEIGS